MSDASQEVQPSEPQPIVNGDAQANGDAAGEQVEQQEELVQVTPVIVRIISPTSTRTLPKLDEPLDTYTLLPQAHETVQELKLAVNEWVGGYWLGPYSLRIPKGKGRKAGVTVEPKEGDGIVVNEGDKLSEWLEVGDVFAGFDDQQERVLEVVREPYTELAARQSVHRLVELITPHGTSLHQPLNPIALSPGATIFESVRDGTASEPTFQEVEVALSNRKNKGKKEVVKVKKEAEHAFADWTSESVAPSFSKLPFSQDMPEAAPCLRSVQISPFNPPPPHLRQKGHQLYIQVATLEGETHTIVCTSRGWYVSKSNVNQFDPAPRTDGAITHSLIDLLHSISPQFSDRVSKLHPLSAEPLALEPISTVPIPQAEPAYPFLANLPKTTALADPIRAQLAYLHTGALTAEALDGARDWNEEIQGIKELPRSSMQERVLREKMAQKTWAEYTATSVRCVLAVARGDIPPLNPNEDPRAHMFLASNIFITKAVDSIDAYSHIGGDAAAHVSHGKDAEGVRILNKLDVEGVHLLGHTVVDWAGERWVCQSMLPGIFARRAGDDEAAQESADADAPAVDAEAEAASDKKEDWVEVSPSKSHKPDADIPEPTSEPTENPLIIYGADSESVNSMHWDAATHKIMSKIATAQRLAAHEVKDDKGRSYEFYASSEVKGLRGTDGRRYFLDLPRLSPVDVEFLEKDTEGKAVGSEEDAGAYPHRVVLLRPELVETFWESELKRWAREIAAKKAKDTEAAKTADEEKPGESSATKQDEPAPDALDDSQATPAASAAAAQRAEADAPLDANIDSSSLAAFNLRLNPDAFVDQAPAKDASDKAYVPSTVTDESDPTIKAVRDASVFLRQVAIPAFVLDTLTGNTSGLMDGVSLSRQLHGRGINIRYLGHLASTVDSFSSGADGEKRESGHLAALKGIVVQEMVVRAAKHVLRPLLVGLAAEHASAAVSHFLNCLLGTSFNAAPTASYDSFDLGGDEAAPAYTQLTPESLRESIVREVKSRYRYALPADHLETGLKKKQLLRELATRLGFQLAQQDYAFDKADAEAIVSEDDKEKTAPAAGKKDKKNKKRDTTAVRKHTFEPSDVLALVPIVRSTAPSASVAEEIFDAGRATINRGSVDLGMEFLLEAVQLYENIHSVIHPEVAFAYNQYASTIHQLARIKIQQMASENGDPEQPLGLDVATAVRLQRQAVIIAERTLGVYHAETCNYYFNLAMLENLEGNAQASLRYFRHVLNLWDVIHGPGHTEINTVLANAGVVLQALGEHALSLKLLVAAHDSTSQLFGPEHIQTGQSLHQLTQAHFLAGDIAAALAASEQSYSIFEKRLGAEHAQTKEVQRNVELLKTVVENVERQKAAGAQAREKQLERLHAAQARVGAGAPVKRRIGATLPSAPGAGPGPSTTAAAAASQDAVAAAAAESKIGEKGHMDVDELVKFIQGGPAKGPSRGKNALRGKRRTGAKR